MHGLVGERDVEEQSRGGVWSGSGLVRKAVDYNRDGCDVDGDPCEKEQAFRRSLLSGGERDQGRVPQQPA